MEGCWSGVPPIWPDKPCDICESKSNVESVQVEVRQGGCVKAFSSHSQSNLCKDCKEKGWIIFGKADVSGRISYFNHKSQEFKHSR